MKIVIAPDSFKGSLTAAEAADAIEIGFRAVYPDADMLKYLWRMVAKAPYNL